MPIEIIAFDDHFIIVKDTIEEMEENLRQLKGKLQGIDKEIAERQKIIADIIMRK